MIAFGLYATGTGGALAINQEFVLKMLNPILSRVEQLSGLAAVTASPGLAAAGVLASAIGQCKIRRFGNRISIPRFFAVRSSYCATGIYYLMAVRDGDEKFKKNTISGRAIFGVNCLAVCAFGQHGSSFLALLGVGDLLASLAMHLTLKGESAKGKKL